MTTITATQAKDLLVKSWNEFNEDQAPRLGAALRITPFSVGPTADFVDRTGRVCVRQGSRNGTVG